MRSHTAAGTAPATPATPALPATPAAILAAVALAAATGTLAAVSAPLALAAAAAAALVAGTLAHPPVALYAYLGVAPLVAGIDRGVLLPLLRPNEALLLVVVAALAVRLVADRAAGRGWPLRLGTVDLALVAMAVTASVLPLLSLVARAEAVTTDDLLGATATWKLVVLFWLTRAAIRDEEQVRRCLAVALAASAVVAVVAILQSRQLLGVPGLLAVFHAPFGDGEALTIGRGTSTLGSSHAVADVMVVALMVVLARLLRGGPRPLLVAGAVLYALGIVASGQFSGLIGLAVAVAALGWMTGQLRRLVRLALPLGALAAVVLWPVVSLRLEGFAGARLPQGWIVRWENLTEVVWPELFSDPWHMAFGVRPATQVPAPEWWRDWIWIESGHTWLLWNGGVPLLVAFLVFLAVSLRATASTARLRDDAVGIAALAAFASLWAVAVLSVFDQHITLRGTADLLLPLLALGVGGFAPPHPAAPPTDDARSAA